ncbi:MAG: DUF393 domain-containing protein [Brucellaceae bacterium]|nr:DUF393 domain-containing protein [Brucellaceae bacterium]
MPRRPLPADAPLPPEARGAPLMIFDGTCVFCSAGARFVHRLDRRRNVRFAHAQSPLGLSLYRHFGWETENFRTNILIMNGTVHSKWATIGAMGRAMGGVWRLAPSSTSSRISSATGSTISLPTTATACSAGPRPASFPTRRCGHA